MPTPVPAPRLRSEPRIHPRADARSPYPRTVGEHVRKALELLEARWEAEGRSLDDLGSPEELAGRMLALVPEPSPWDAGIGPVYTTAAVARLLGGVTRQAVAERRRRRTVLALRTADGEIVYPAFQFTDGGEVVPGLADVLACFAGAPVDEWTVAGWLNLRQAQLDGRSAADWLAGRGDPSVVVAAATASARRMAE